MLTRYPTCQDKGVYNLDPSGCNDSEGHGDDRLHVNHVFSPSKPSQKLRGWNSMVRRGISELRGLQYTLPFDSKLTRAENV